MKVHLSFDLPFELENANGRQENSTANLQSANAELESLKRRLASVEDKVAHEPAVARMQFPMPQQVSTQTSVQESLLDRFDGTSGTLEFRLTEKWAETEVQRFRLYYRLHAPEVRNRYNITYRLTATLSFVSFDQVSDRETHPPIVRETERFEGSGQYQPIGDFGTGGFSATFTIAGKTAKLFIPEAGSSHARTTGAFVDWDAGDSDLPSHHTLPGTYCFYQVEGQFPRGYEFQSENHLSQRRFLRDEKFCDEQTRIIELVLQGSDGDTDTPKQIRLDYKLANPVVTSAGDDFFAPVEFEVIGKCKSTGPNGVESDNIIHGASLSNKELRINFLNRSRTIVIQRGSDKAIVESYLSGGGRAANEYKASGNLPPVPAKFL